MPAPDAPPWWLYLLAIVPLNLRPGDPLVSLLYVVANSLEIVSTAAVLRLVSRGRPRLDDLRNCLAFLLVGVILAPLISGFIGALAVCGSTRPSPSPARGACGGSATPSAMSRSSPRCWRWCRSARG